MRSYVISIAISWQAGLSEGPREHSTAVGNPGAPSSLAGPWHLLS